MSMSLRHVLTLSATAYATLTNLWVVDFTSKGHNNYSLLQCIKKS